MRLFRSKVAALQFHTQKSTILLYKNIAYVLCEKYLYGRIGINITSCSFILNQKSNIKYNIIKYYNIETDIFSGYLKTGKCCKL